MSGLIGDHIRSNVVGYIALFCFAMSGTAVALDGSNTVFSDDIVNNAVRTADVRDDTLDGGGLAAVDLAPDSVAASEVEDQSLTGNDLASNSVGSLETAPDSVGSEEVRPDSLVSQDLAIGSVGSSELASNSVGPAEICPDCVSQSHLAAGSVGTSEIATESVGTFDIAPNAVTGSRVADGSLTPEDVGVFSARVSSDGTVTRSSGGVTGVKPYADLAFYYVGFGRNVSDCVYAATPENRRYQAGAQPRGNPNPAAVRVEIVNETGGAVSAASFNLIVVC